MHVKATPGTPPVWGLCNKPAGADQPEKFPDVPGGDLFGFTSPTDVGSAGDCGLAFEYSGATGKTDGRYQAGTLKIQFGATVAENLAVAIAPFVTHHRIRSVAGLDDVDRAAFDGISGEVSWRFVERSPANRVAATFSIEPRWARVDGGSGAPVTAYSVEFKLFTDAVLIADRLFGALNVNYATATQRADNDPAAGWTRSSSTNLSGALTYQINERWFIGAEARYLAAFEGAALDRNVGEALFVGPTLLVNLSSNAALNLVWTPQVWGRAAGVDRRLDLDNFERHQFRAKLSVGF